DRQVRLAWQRGRVGHDNRQLIRQDVDDLRLHPHGLEAVAEPPRVAQTVVAALGKRAYRGDAQLFDEVVEVLLAMRLCSGQGRLERRLDGSVGAETLGERLLVVAIDDRLGLREEAPDTNR